MGQGEDDTCTCAELLKKAVIYVVVLVIFILLIGFGTPENPVYHVGIVAVAGLDPSTDLYQPTLDPEFDLRVHIGQGLWGQHPDACLEFGSAVAVSYRRVPLAVASLPSRRCAGDGGEAGKSATAAAVPIVVRGSGVRVPDAVRDALARDMMWAWGSLGGPEFDVSLTVPYQGRWKVALCKARLADAAALRVGPCNVTVVGTFQQASPFAPQIVDLPGTAGIPLDAA